jgi:hypothetical protein
VAGRDPKQPDGARCGGANELLELSVENGDLIVESVDPSGDGAQRELCGVRGAAQLANRWSQPAAECGLAADRLRSGELVAKLLRCGHDQSAELDHGGAAGLHRAVSGRA